MRVISYVAVSIVLIAVALVGWAVFLPASHPVLERAGLLAPMRAVGLPVAADESRGGGGGPPFGGGGGGVRVVAQEVGMVDADDRLGAIGTAEALRSVSLTPEVSGRLEEVFATAGEWVEAGTVIAQLDAEAQELAVDRAELRLQDAQARADRVAQLRESGAATEVQIQEADLALNQARLDLRDAEFELRRRQIVAPVSGYVGLIGSEPGNQVSSGTEIARLDDRSTLLVEFNIPERFVGLVNAGDTLDVSPLSRPQELVQGRIRAVDARVDQASRSLRLQGEIDNSNDRLRPGMAFRITVRLPGQSYPSVDPLSIQWDRRGAFVWAVDNDDKATRVPIEIVQRRDDAVLLRADLDEGMRVVLEGVQNLRPGAEVSIDELMEPATPGSGDLLTRRLEETDGADSPDI